MSSFFLKLQQPLVILVVGASGDLAKKKTYPALYDLWKAGLLPEDTAIWGFARTAKTHEQLREHVSFEVDRFCVLMRL